MEYVRLIKPLFINAHENGYIVGKIYKTHPKYHTLFNQGFINSDDHADGYNKMYFIPATEEEYNIQEGIHNLNIKADLTYLVSFLNNLKIT